MKIYAPVKDANGIWASVRFVDGVGETDNPALIEWFKTHGYTLENGDESDEHVIEKCEEEHVPDVTKTMVEPDFESMTPNDLRDWAREHGLGGKIKNTRNKEKLLEIIRG